MNRRDRTYAAQNKFVEVSQLASLNGVEIDAATIDRFVRDQENAPTTALFAYGHDLLRRVAGTAVDPSSLVLWREFAWSEGRPIRGFDLTAEMILSAETQVLSGLHQLVSEDHPDRS
ncbi:MAG: hypothetical protein AAGJ97_11060 [Planctomycetota bacterium]